MKIDKNDIPAIIGLLFVVFLFGVLFGYYVLQCKI